MTSLTVAAFLAAALPKCLLAAETSLEGKMDFDSTITFFSQLFKLLLVIQSGKYE